MEVRVPLPQQPSLNARFASSFGRQASGLNARYALQLRLSSRGGHVAKAGFSWTSLDASVNRRQVVARLLPPALAGGWGIADRRRRTHRHCRLYNPSCSSGFKLLINRHLILFVRHGSRPGCQVCGELGCAGPQSTASLPEAAGHRSAGSTRPTRPRCGASGLMAHPVVATLHRDGRRDQGPQWFALGNLPGHFTGRRRRGHRPARPGRRQSLCRSRRITPKEMADNAAATPIMASVVADLTERIK